MILCEYMNKTTVIGIALISVIIGFSFGYGIQKQPKVANTVHQMPDGSMMSNAQNMMDMDDMMKNMNAGLVGKQGDAFDAAFITEMIVHHQGAVEMAQLALINAKHQEIKDLAQAIITAQNKEIGDMKMWQTSWYGNN